MATSPLLAAPATAITVAVALTGPADETALVTLVRAGTVGLPIAIGLRAYERQPGDRFALLLIALGGGIGVALLMTQMRPTFDDEHRLRKVSELTVLGTVAMAWTDGQKARRRRGLFAFLVSLAALLSAYAAIMATVMLTVAKA